jgi:murein DD-endopeptidase MepM/ murein hydrolase activator NlpD
MSRFATGIREGSFVRQGETIGYVGSTGLATGPHVCYRFWKNGQQVDHLREEFPATEPIPDTLASAYQDHLDDHRLQLRIYDHPFSDLTEAAVLF